MSNMLVFCLRSLIVLAAASVALGGDLKDRETVYRSRVKDPTVLLPNIAALELYGLHDNTSSAHTSEIYFNDAQMVLGFYVVYICLADVGPSPLTGSGIFPFSGFKVELFDSPNPRPTYTYHTIIEDNAASESSRFEVTGFDAATLPPGSAPNCSNGHEPSILALGLDWPQVLDVVTSAPVDFYSDAVLHFCSGNFNFDAEIPTKRMQLFSYFERPVSGVCSCGQSICYTMTGSDFSATSLPARHTIPGTFLSTTAILQVSGEENHPEMAEVYVDEFELTQGYMVVWVCIPGVGPGRTTWSGTATTGAGSTLLFLPGSPADVTYVSQTKLNYYPSQNDFFDIHFLGKAQGLMPVTCANGQLANAVSFSLLWDIESNLPLDPKDFAWDKDKDYATSMVNDFKAVICQVNFELTSKIGNFDIKLQVDIDLKEQVAICDCSFPICPQNPPTASPTSSPTTAPPTALPTAPPAP